MLLTEKASNLHLRLQNLIIPKGIHDLDEKNFLMRKHLVILSIALLEIVGKFKGSFYPGSNSESVSNLELIVSLIEFLLILIVCNKKHEFLSSLLMIKTALFGPLANALFPEMFNYIMNSIFLTPILILFFSEAGVIFGVNLAIQVFSIIFIIPDVLRLMIIQAANQERVIQTLIYSFIEIELGSAFIIFGVYFGFKNFRVGQIRKEVEKLQNEKSKSFVYSFGIDFKNIVNMIKGNIQICSINNKSDEKLNYLRSASLYCDLLLQLFNNITDLKSSQIENLQIRPVSVNFHEKLKETWQICKFLIEKNGIKAEISVSKDIPPSLKLDYEKLSQVILNVISNASKFTSKGKISLIIKWLPDLKKVDENCFSCPPFDDDGLHAKTLSLTHLSGKYYTFDGNYNLDEVLNYGASSRNGVLRIEIIDTGCGIEEEKLKDVFDKFVINDDLKKKEGVGVSLFISKKIILKMNGEIRAFSRINSGSAFVMCLYCENVPLEEAHENCPISYYLIEDDPKSKLEIEATLRKMKIEISSNFESGFEAFEKYKHSCQLGYKPTFILLKHDIPAGGRMTANKIREFEWLNKMKMTPILVYNSKIYDSPDEFSKKCGYPKIQLVLKSQPNFQSLEDFVKKID